jgi:hypothetical protein
MTNQNKQPITRHYILGIGRSGTTLLVNIFNRHKNVLATPESVFTQFFFSSFKNKTVFTEKDISAILDYIATYEKLAPFINWSFEYSFFKSIKYPLEITFDDLINLIHLQFKFPQHEQQEIRYIVDKNPGNSLFGEQLFQLNENSKAIVMIRDYRANILSRKEKTHWRTPDVIYNAIRWLTFNQSLLKLKFKNPNKVLFIKYEDMVTNQDKTVKKIFSFLSISYSKELLSIKEEQQENNLTEKYKHLSSGQVKILETKIKSVNSPIYTSRIDKWKTVLTEEEIRNCDSICSRFGKNFGYEKFKPFNKPFILKCSPSFIKGRLSITKQKILFKLPYSIKLKRLKNIVSKIT